MALRVVPAVTRVNFMRRQRLFLLLSAFMMIASIVSIAVQGLNFGIDFRGGILIEVKTQGPADIGQMRQTLERLNLGEVSLQEFGEPDDVLIRVSRQEGGEAEQVQAIGAIKNALGSGVEYRRTEYVGPKVGDELVNAGIWAVVLAMGAIAIYIWFRFEWQFGLSGLIALFHDVITTVGLFSLLQLPFDLATVAAVLTVAGYSINDTVVVYDRVRENLRKYKRMDLDALFNLSLNDTLSRTILTSGTTLIAVMALVIFGGPVIRDFSIAMIWGILIGTYSSVYLALPLLRMMDVKGALAQRRGEETPAEQAGPSAP